jgi:UDP-N-acetylmuramoyl-tripeptide--D-alanyl-D-alanine ligase
MQLSMGEVARLLGASNEVAEATPLGYSIDSRTISPADLFFAIRGPRFNGHDFVVQVVESGAVGAVVERAFAAKAAQAIRPKLIAVDDTTEALQRLARAVRRKWGQRIVAVTGSAGKTTTKELIAALLGTRLSVHKSPGNLNNDYGLPLSLLGLEPNHDVAVLELAMSAPGEIARLTRLAEPDIGVVTNVAPVHLESFDSLDGVARAKRELIENLKDPAVAVLNYDDPHVRQFAEGFTGRVLTYGFEQGADLRALHFRQNVGNGVGTVSQFIVAGAGISGEFLLPLLGRHNVQNALAALAAASLFGISADELRRALAAFGGLHQRGEILNLPSLITIINDTYNSNPVAMERMLDTLASWPAAGRRIVVAGEMLELGPTAPELHRRVGRKCPASRVDWLIAVQGDAASFVEGARSAGMSRERTRFFNDVEAAGEFCRELVRPLDVILVKGSHAVHLEKVIEVLQSREKGKSESAAVGEAN